MKITVQELIERLSDLPPEFLVVMSKDGEGNGFSPLADLSHEEYISDSTYSGDIEDGEPNAIVLWPTN
ncbi:MAG: hypothetical protein ACRC5T_10695 [Cetobacterium sp.]